MFSLFTNTLRGRFYRLKAETSRSLNQNPKIPHLRFRSHRIEEAKQILNPSMSSKPESILNLSRKKKKKPKPEPFMITSLPDELMLSCIARLSRFYHPTLSLVSKRFPSLLASPELYNSRSLLNRTESCLYVLLNNSKNNTRWFTLSRKRIGKHILVPISTSQSPEICDSVYVAVGSEIYSIGGNYTPTSRVSVLDCRSHIWLEAPSMKFKTPAHSVCVVDGNICVVRDGEGYESDYLKSIEVFDTKTQVWDLVHGPPWEMNMVHFIYKSVGFDDGKVHLLSYGEDLTYDLKKGKWDLVERKMDRNWIWNELPYCVIDNVLYCYDYEEEQHQLDEGDDEEEEEDEDKIWFKNRYGSPYEYDYDKEEEAEVKFWFGDLDGSDCSDEEEDKNMFVWYDTEVKCWKSVKGLVRFPEFPCYDDYRCVKLVDYGGKMAVLWDNGSENRKKKKIWCAVIALERRIGDENGDEIWGKVEWYDSVLKVSDSCEMLEVLAVTL